VKGARAAYAQYAAGARHAATTNVVYLRFVELFALFAIVFIARYFGDFHYRSNALLLAFLGAALLQYNAEWLAGVVGSRVGWDRQRREHAVLWYSSFVDLGIVLTLIYLTGTIESPFLFLLTVPLYFASNTFSWRLTTAAFFSTAMVTLAVLATLEMTGTIPHNSCYAFEPGVYNNGNYVAGSLLVVGALVALVLFLSNAFRDRMRVSVERLRRQGEESETRMHELSRLFDISLGINAAMSIDTLLKIVAKEATLLLDLPWAAIVLFNEKQDVTHSVFVGVNQNHEVKLERRVRRGGLSEWIWTHNAPIVVENASNDKRANCSEFLTHYGIRSIIGFPLTTGKNVMGVIYSGDFEPRAIRDHQIRLLTTLSAQLSTAIEKSALHELLERKIREQDKQMRALEKTNILKSDFVTHVSHELRTPLTSIKAYVETLCDNIEEPTFKQRREFLEIVSKETNRLIRIVNDILDVSKIEFGQRPLQRSSFELRGVVDEVLSMLLPTLQDRNIEVKIEIPETLPRIDADPDLVKQVFINLLTNAVKYSPPKTTVTVRAKEGPVEIAVSVADQGVGIPADEVNHVFDKYFRARSRGSQKLEGVGLGLAIVKNIVEQHGGSVDVESEEGVGSKFSFTIPREHCFNDLIGYIAEVVDARDQLQEMLELIVRMIAELLQAKIVSLMLLDKTRSELFIKLSYGLDEWIVNNTRVKVGEGIAGKVAETGTPLFIHNIEENEMYSCPNNPQYETVSLLSVPLVVNEVVVGVINVNNKADGKALTQDDLNLLISFSERISRALERVRVVEDSRAFLEDTIEAFRRMLETQTKTKLMETAVVLAVKVSRKLGLSEKEVAVVQYVASVHDIGMTEISDNILNKTLNLSSEERQQIEKHPQRGAELIRPLEFVESVSNIILYHHERVDGEGYPMGLRGDQIPMGARVLAVIDAFQSITTGRPYKPARSVEQAVRELVRYAEHQFDVEVVDAFISVLREEGEISTDQEREFRRVLRGVAAAPRA
jgi:signal transduction histidine kinase/HD-GYP domain-containing protein (c-di-GMP phosphodiesterase class II)